jgi:hypothetical protein
MALPHAFARSLAPTAGGGAARRPVSYSLPGGLRLQPVFSLFGLCQLFELEGGVTQDAVQDAAPDILPLCVASIRQFDHVVCQGNGSVDVFIAGFHESNRSGIEIAVSAG